MTMRESTRAKVSRPLARAARAAPPAAQVVPTPKRVAAKASPSRARGAHSSPETLPRTQEARRTGTIRKLLDAACEELVVSGYAGATTAKICERAGTSQGGLFRHFPTREALMVAVGIDVGEAMLGSYEATFRAATSSMSTLPTSPPNDQDVAPLVGALALVRGHCRSRKNQAFYELVMAARTDDRLRAALGPATAAYYASIEALARSLLPDLARSLGPRFPLLVDTLLAVFDGEALHGFVLPDAALRDGPRVEFLATIVRLLAG